MNVESLKTELQQVLNNDVELRKEFNALKRSLSDYRNQLIMRDEDCKRLQVTIDVLNTKLLVLERDNTNYKEELTSFKELRGSIKDQLQEKQNEIEARLSEIQGLRDDLNSMAAGYESQIEKLKEDASTELVQVKQELNAQINELKTNTHYKENGLREDFENRVSELSVSWADKEQSLQLNHEEELMTLKSNYEEKLLNSSSQSEKQIDLLKTEHQAALSLIDGKYKSEIENLRTALDEQRETLTNNFHKQVENLKIENKTKEDELISSYENKIQDLEKEHHLSITETVSVHEIKISGLIGEYEEKLSNTLIQSNVQNSKLSDELGKMVEEHGSLNAGVQSIQTQLDTKNQEIDSLSTHVNELEAKLLVEGEKIVAITSEFDLYKQNASLSVSEQVNELNNQITSLNHSHSDYVNELNSQIENLNTELKNFGVLFESTTNALAETEYSLERKTQELTEAVVLVNELNKKIEVFENNLKENEGTLELQKNEIHATIKEELKLKDLEYSKLLAENTNLIEEIDAAADKIEAQESEISIMKGELEEIRMQSAGKTEYFKEILSNRNFEMTNLEANNAALNLELSQVKNEVNLLRDQVTNYSESGHHVTDLQNKVDALSQEKMLLQTELSELKGIVASLNDNITTLNSKIVMYEGEIESLRNNAKLEEQEAFIDKLFKQIDHLNDQKLALLDEKEQMANQLLKMNDVVGSISQQVDNEKIDVSSLNTHRKNVILANNSGKGNESPIMKEQINDLVREIDKCIALLSA